jgi:hypothetical protein
MQTRKEKWIFEIEESLENVKSRVSLDSSFKANLVNRLLQDNKNAIFSKKTVWTIAASFILLVSANVFVGTNGVEWASNQVQTEDEYSEFIESYDLLPSSLLNGYSS